MTKAEIIEATLQQIEYRQNPPPEEIADCVGIEGYDDFVIATLAELLPSGDTKTCENFKDIGVECCETCHRYYPHYDMSLEALPDGSKAWICCNVRSALRKSDSKMDESRLGGMGGHNTDINGERSHDAERDHRADY